MSTLESYSRSAEAGALVFLVAPFNWGILTEPLAVLQIHMEPEKRYTALRGMLFSKWWALRLLASF